MMDAPARTKARPRADHHPRWGVARRTGVRDDPQREQDDQVIQAVAEKTAGDGASRRNLSLRIHGWVAEGSSGRRRTVPRKGQDGRKRWGASTSTSWRASFPPSSRMNETFGIRSEERRGDRRFAFLEGGPTRGRPIVCSTSPRFETSASPRCKKRVATCLMTSPLFSRVISVGAGSGTWSAKRGKTKARAGWARQPR